MRALIIGCGYLGRRVADLWTASGHDVSALTRSVDNAADLRNAGVHALIGDVLEPARLAQLPDADVLVYAVGYDRRGAHSRREVSVAGLDNVLAALSGRVGRVIYISSTSVYGQEDGSWIDEDSACRPVTDSGRICLEAEQTFHARVADGRLPGATVLRLAGLYGPGRLIGRLDQLRGGAPLPGAPDAWLNLIHVVDAARCVDAVARGRARHPLYLVADDEPVRRVEFYAELARRAGTPGPEFDPSTSAERVSGLGKRIRNARLHCDLIEQLQFPDYRAGLAASFAERDAGPEVRTPPR